MPKHVTLDIQQYVVERNGYNAPTWGVLRTMISNYIHSKVRPELTRHGSAPKDGLIIEFTSIGQTYVLGAFEKYTTTVDTQVVYDVFRREYMLSNMWKTQKQDIFRSRNTTPRFTNTPMNNSKFELIDSGVGAHKLVQLLGAFINNENKDARNFYLFMKDKYYTFKSVEMYIKTLRATEYYHPISIWTNHLGYIPTLHGIIKMHDIAYITRYSDLYHIKDRTLDKVYLHATLKEERITVENGERYSEWVEIPDDGRYIQDYVWEAFEQNCPKAQLIAIKFDGKTVEELFVIQSPIKQREDKDEYIQVYSQDPEVLDAERQAKADAAEEFAQEYVESEGMSFEDALARVYRELPILAPIEEEQNE